MTSIGKNGRQNLSGPSLPYPNKKVVALTGGMGSGKTSVAAFLGTLLGCPCINADFVNRNLLLPGERGWIALRDVFGDRFFSPDHTVDTGQLRKVLFSDIAVRQTINQILHPLIREEILKEIVLLDAVGSSAVVLVEVPLLFEVGWRTDYDVAVVVHARPAVCVERLMARDCHSRPEARLMVASQMPSADKALLADHVIDNSGPWADTCYQMLRVGRILADCRFPRDRYKIPGIEKVGVVSFIDQD